jgi:hypothetical protein
MKHPNDLLGFEPMEGWGMANTLASGFICIFTPFRMAGFSSRNETVETTFDFLSALVLFIVALDMCSHWLSNQVRHRKVGSYTKKAEPGKGSIGSYSQSNSDTLVLYVP